MKLTAGLKIVSLSVIIILKKNMTKIAILFPSDANIPYVNKNEPIVAITVDFIIVCFSK